MSYQVINQASTNARYVVADSQDTGSRYMVSVMVDGSGTYFISVYNFRIALETKNPRNIAYKLNELGMTQADATVVESIVSNMLG